MSTPSRLVSLAHAVPAEMNHEGLWTDHFAAQFGGDERAAGLWRAAGVTTRHGVLDPRVEDCSTWSTGERMRRFMIEAPLLGKEALTGVLGPVDPVDVGLFAVASCTGYATPGLDIVLSRDTGMADSVQRLGIGHMGCYAALPGLLSVADFARARSRPAVLLCCELTSLHVQPASSGGLEQLVAHSLFADAAAAAAVLPGDLPDLPAGLEVLDSEAVTDPDTSELMTWDVTDLGFRMGLSPKVPDALSRHVRGVVDRLLGRHDATVHDVAGWAVHPGGPRILDVVAERCELAPDALDVSRRVLDQNGNCSSATVLMVTEELLATQELAPGDLVLLMAFGPGLTLYTVLTRWAPATS